MRGIFRIALIAVALTLSACSREPVARLVAPDDAVATADDAVMAVLLRNNQALSQEIGRDSGWMYDWRWQTAFRREFPFRIQTAPRVIDWSGQGVLGNSEDRFEGMSRGSSAHLTLRYEARIGDAVQVRFKLVKHSGRYRVIWMSPQFLSHDLVEMNAFNAPGKTQEPTLFLFVPLVLLCFVLASTVACLLARQLPNKLAWIAVIWIGVFQITLNWTTAEFSIVPLAFSIPPVAIKRQNEWEPILVMFTFPIGAVYYWIAHFWRRRKRD